jgi:protein-tyrosine-phosphatase
MRSVLFVGRRNAARSVMAETCFNSAAIHGWRAFSAGWQTGPQIDRQTIRALRARGFPTDTLAPKPVDIFLQPGAPLINLCVFMDEQPPRDISQYPARQEFWHVQDPSGSGDANAAYALVLDEVSRRISCMILAGRLFTDAEPLRIAS